MRNPNNKMALTSLEEDFKNIGILDESDISEDVEDDDLVNEEGDEETLSEDDLEERMIRAAGGRKKVRVKKMKAGEKAQARRAYRKRKSKIKKARKKRARSSRGKKLAKLAKAMASKMRKESSEFEGLTSDRINHILEDVQDIVASVNEDSGVDFTEEDIVELDNAIKSFANVAIISEMLSEFFSEAAELVEDDEELYSELDETAEYFQEQAEAAAYLATSLDEGTDLDERLDVDSLFQEQMDALVEGLELYADLTEDSDEDEDDDSIEEMGKSYGDEDEGEGSDKKKKMPAFLKKKLGKQ